jgi:hypothetical protein
VAALRGDVAMLRAEIAEARGQASQAASVRTGEPTAEPHAPAVRSRASLAEYEAARRAEIQQVETDFENQPRDSRWATTATTAIQEGLRTDDALSSAHTKVDCRSRSCRVELVEDAPGKLSESLRPLLSRLGGTFPASTLDYENEAGGQRKIVVYLDSQLDPSGSGK